MKKNGGKVQKKKKKKVLVPLSMEKLRKKAKNLKFFEKDKENGIINSKVLIIYIYFNIIMYHHCFWISIFPSKRRIFEFSQV